jgi:hypothetical protein
LPPRIAVQPLRRGRTSVDVLQLSETVVPMPGASMRLLEFTIAIAALAVAVLLSFAH